jgi:hypothetical protein
MAIKKERDCFLSRWQRGASLPAPGGVKQNGKMIDGDELEKRLPNPAWE